MFRIRAIGGVAMIALLVAAGGSTNAAGGAAVSSSHRLVPGHPVALIVTYLGGTRTAGDPARATPGLVVDGRRIRQLVHALNHLKPVPEGVVFHCPADFGGSIRLRFLYAARGPFRVAMRTSGCAWVFHASRRQSILGQTYWTSPASKRSVNRAYRHRLAFV